MNKILFCMLVSLAGCSTLHKVKDVKRTSIDSTAHAHSDSGGVKKNNTVTTKESNGSWEKETVFEFGTGTVDSGIIHHKTRENDYEGAKEKTVPITGFTTAELKAIGVTKVTIKEKGITRVNESTTSVSVDTAFKKASNDVSITKQETIKSKTVERKSYTTLYIILIVGAVATFLLWYYWTPISLFFMVLFKRRKNDNGRSV